MTTFEFHFYAECGTPLHILIVEAQDISEAMAEVPSYFKPDADTVRVTVDEIAR